MAICLHSLKYDYLSTLLEGVGPHKLTYTLVNLGKPLNIDRQSEETTTSSSPDLKQLHSGKFTKM